ncbi:MAG: hypothetical protein Q4B28_07840 [bacterium]|nr:hypothetical protein [bacterium]
MKRFLCYGGMLILSIFSLSAQPKCEQIEAMLISIPDTLSSELHVYLDAKTLQAPRYGKDTQGIQMSMLTAVGTIENIGGKYFDFYSDREVKARLILKNGQSYAIVLPVGLGAFARFAPELHSIHFEEGAEGVLRFFPTGREPKASLPLISLYSD